MQCIITYATGMYQCLSKISSKTYIFHSGYLSSGYFIFMWARMWGSVVILRSQKGVREQQDVEDARLAAWMASIWHHATAPSPLSFFTSTSWQFSTLFLHVGFVFPYAKSKVLGSQLWYRMSNLSYSNAAHCIDYRQSTKPSTWLRSTDSFEVPTYWF